MKYKSQNLDYFLQSLDYEIVNKNSPIILLKMNKKFHNFKIKFFILQ